LDFSNDGKSNPPTSPFRKGGTKLHELLSRNHPFSFKKEGLGEITEDKTNSKDTIKERKDV